MSGVKRYAKRLTRTQIELAQPRTEFVLASDYDALEAELATVKKVAYGNLELMEERDTLRTANQRLEGENKRLREALRDADEYLSDNPFNEIGSGSILHRQMKAALTSTGEKQ